MTKKALLLRRTDDFLKVLRQQTKVSIGQCLFCLEFTGIYSNPLKWSVLAAH